jgi:hypothetical protein
MKLLDNGGGSPQTAELTRNGRLGKTKTVRSPHKWTRTVGRRIRFILRVNGGMIGSFRAARRIELRLGKGGIAAEGHLFALYLLPVDLRQQEFLPTIDAVEANNPFAND